MALAERDGPDWETTPTVQDIFDRDAIAPPATLRKESTISMPTDDIPKERYLSQAWHDIELETVWNRVWQVACREEHIPNVGDYVVYDIGKLSVLVVRSAPDRVQAFPNSCLHRGAALADCDGHAEGVLRCPFHGFAWDLDGQLRFVPTEWDFPHLDRRAFCLPEIKVGVWRGWVFVNSDPEAMSLEEYLGGFPDAFPWPQEELAVTAHVAKELRCNWKLALEAFLEALHVMATHPQLAPMLGDVNSQYDVYPGEPRWSRIITPTFVASPLLGEVSEQQIMDAALDVFIGADVCFPVGEGQTARELLAQFTRLGVQAVLGPDTVISESEAADAIQYFVFPNFVPWGGWGRLNYRFRPGERPDRSVMEVILLEPFKPDGPRPAPAPLRRLGPDEEWGSVAELGKLGPVFDQDTLNLERLQRGLESSRKPGVTLSRYQESRIRHFHLELERWTQEETPQWP